MWLKKTKEKTEKHEADVPEKAALQPLLRA